MTLTFTPIPCIVCRKQLENYVKDGNQPDNGLQFFTSGHYGTTVFDPMDGSCLIVNICDECLKQAAKDHAVLYLPVQPQPEFYGLRLWDGK